jgi:hypothetical protein
MSDWIPPGYIDVTELVRQHGVDRVRNDLFGGRLQADGWKALYPIERTFWLADDAPRWLATGLMPDGPERPPHRILVRAEDELKPPPATVGVYLSPFMVLMLEAVRRFEINEQRWPKKEELEEYFRAQKLPDGTPISLNHARLLATFCRPLAAMSGGNSKAVKPFNPLRPNLG